MKLPFLPGPSDVLSAVGGVRGGLTEALALVPRLATVVGRVEALLDRVDAVVDGVEGVVGRADAAITAVADTRARADDAIAAVDATRQKADAAITAVADTRARADDAIAAVDATRQKADAAITAVGGTISGADGTIARAEGLLGRVDPMVDVVQEPLLALAPALRRLAASVDPAEVEAVVTFIDRLPRLMTHLDEDVLPAIGSLRSVGADVHDLLDTMQDLRQVVKGFPGSRLFRRRGAEEIADDEQLEAAEGR